MSKKEEKKKNLGYESKNGYETISDKDLKKCEELNKAYMDYLGKSKTEREAHDEAIELLEAAGFKDMEENKLSGKKLKAGDRVYYSCEGKTLMAIVVGKQPLEKGMHIVGGHTDAPRLDVKQNPLYESTDVALMDTHYYGGIKKYQWLTIPLAIHGVFVKPDGKKISIAIGEDPSDPVFCITDILPHLAADQYKNTIGTAIPGESLDLTVASIPVKDKDAKNKIKENLLQILNKKYGIEEEDFLSAELEIVPAAKPRECGFDRSMILGYGHDDRVCSYTGLKALIDVKGTPEYTSMVLLCDKEEIGSVGSTGMASNFFENACAELLALTTEEYCELSLKRPFSFVTVPAPCS